MGRLRAGTRRRVEAVAVDGSATLSAPDYFAPGVENCTITYEFRRGPSLQGQPVTMTIKDRNNALVYESRLIGLAADRRDSYDWNGRDRSNNLVTPERSPFTIEFKVGRAITRRREVRVEVKQVNVWTRQYPRIYMNTPEEGMDCAATILIRRTNGTGARTPIPIFVTWSFDAHRNNLVKTSSFEYRSAGHLRLGKKGDANAVFWEAHPHCRGNTSSADSYHQTCRAQTVTTAGANMGKSFVKFKPSGVGGDQFRLVARVFWADGTTVMNTGRRGYMTVWRDVRFTASEMQATGQRHVSTYGSEAIMRTYYTNDTFVRYRLGTVTAINRTYCVKYIGLWDHAHTRMENWSTFKRKKASNNEVPAAADVTAANGRTRTAAERTARDQARARIRTCAERWRDRIINAYRQGLNNWASDASVPRNTVVSVEFEHPKYSANAPNADSVTSEWSGANYSWLRIRVEGHDIHPDQRWVRGQGLSKAGRAYIFAGMSAARTKVVIAHEIGHETKNQFKRHQFRARSARGRPEDSDHTPGSGLMQWTANRSSFTAGEKQILRGWDNP